MKDKLLTKKNLHLLLAAAMGLGCCLLGLLTTNLYTDTDNYWIATVVNGLYSRDVYTIFLHPFLCRFFGLLARLLPTADAYMLTYRVLLLLANTFLAWLALEHGRSLPEKLAWLALLPAMTVALWLWSTNFTVQAAFFTGTGLIGLAADGGKKHPVYRAAGVLFIALGMMVRMEAAEIFIPFGLLVLAARLLDSRKRLGDWARTAWKPLAALLLCLAVLTAGQKLVDRADRYQADYAYNAGRSMVQDFPLKAWEEVEDDFAGEVTKTEFSAVRRWVLFDTERLDADMLQKIGTVAAEDADFESAGLLQTAADTLRSVRYMGVSILFLILLSLLLALRLCCGGNLWHALAGLCAIAGGALIIVYFTYIGRAPERVWDAVLLAQISAQAALAASCGDGPRRERLSVWSANLIIALTIFLLSRLVTLDSLRRPQLALTARTGYETLETDLADTFQGDDLYIWNANADNWYNVINHVYAFNGKLPSREFFDHNICTGNWLYGQHYYSEYFARLDASNPAEALLHREHTYFVSDDTRLFLRYLREHYGDVAAEEAGEVYGLPVWRFSLSESE